MNKGLRPRAATRNLLLLKKVALLDLMNKGLRLADTMPIITNDLEIVALLDLMNKGLRRCAVILATVLCILAGCTTRPDE